MEISITYNPKPNVELEQALHNLLEWEGYLVSGYEVIERDAETSIEITYQCDPSTD